MAVTLRWGSSSDTGRLREINEDSLLVTETLWAVADGMGGHAAGEVASRIAVEALRVNASPSVDGVVEAIRQANESIIAAAEADPAKHGMGTTMSALAVVPGERGDELVVANVGDSRVYRLHQGELEQLSEDHSLVEDLVREGRITAAEARVHPNRNIVTRALGNEADVGIDWWVVDPAEGDRYLLCSDGLTDEIEDDEIAQVLRTVRDPGDAARRLVEIANDAGGRDNITCIVVDVVDDGGRAERASAALATDRSETTARPVVHEEGRATAVGAAPPAADPAPARPRRFTWRVAVFVAAVVLVVAGALAGTAWFARNTYFVALDDDGCVTIFKGRPGGLLWFDPTVERCTDLTIDDIAPSRRDEVRDGHDASSVEDAERYVENITMTTSTTTPTTTPTTTSTPPTTSTTAAP